MSYILDALKKSEEERKRGSIPDPLAVQENVLRTPKKKNLWRNLAIFVVALNIVVFSLWIYAPPSKKSAAPAKSVSRTVVREEKIPIPSAVKETASPSNSASNNAPASSPKEKPIPNKPASPAPVQQQVRVADVKKSQPESPKVPVEVRKKPTVAMAAPVDMPDTSSQTEKKSENIPPPEPNRLYNIVELPPAVRQGLPEFVVSVFLYSEDSASRMVRVNGKMLREGQLLDAGLKVEEIIPNGVVFSYRHYRFLIGPR